MKRIQVLHNGKVKSLPANEVRVLLLLKKATLVEPVVPALLKPKVHVEEVFGHEVRTVDGQVEVSTINDTEPVFVDARVPEPVAYVPMPQQEYAESVEETSTAEISPRTGKPKRTYRRRDLTAGDE